MNTSRNHSRLNALAADIARLDREILEAEREALEPSKGETAQSLAMMRAATKKAQLERQLRAYFIESEVVRLAERRAA